MNARGPPPPPPPVAIPVFHDGPRPQQPAGFPQQGPMLQRPPHPIQVFNSSTRVSDITPQVMLTEEFCRRQLTAYEVYTLRKAEPINSPDFQDIKKDQGFRKQKKGSKHSTGPKPNWQRVTVSQEVYDQETVLKNIKALDRRHSITDKKAGLKPHMNTQVNNLLDEKNNLEFDRAFTWMLCQFDRTTVYNKTSKTRETETLTLYLKRTPRPDINVMMVYRNIERAKLQQGQPPPQQQQFPPQQRAPSNGPPQGQPKNPAGRVGPPPVQVVYDAPKNMGQPKNGRKFGGNGGHDDDIIHVIEPDRPQRKHPGKKVYNGRKGVHYRSDDSRSSRSSTSDGSSGSDSDSSSAYSDSETNATTVSMSSVNRRRRDSGYSRGKAKGPKQHEKGYFMVDRPRRHSAAAYAPEPPRIRAQSYERLSRDPTEIEQRISEAKAEGFATGFTTASRVSAIDRMSMPPPKTIMYPDDHSSLRSLDGDIRALDDTRAEVVRLENLRLQDDLHRQDDLRRQADLRRQDDLRLREDLRRREDLRLREDVRLREEANSRLRDDVKRFSDVPTREELRLHNDLRHARATIRQDELPSPRMRDPDYFRRGSVSPLAFDSLPFPQAREFEFPRRGSLSPLPMEHDMPYQYVQNPFTPRRRQPLYRD